MSYEKCCVCVCVLHVFCMCSACVLHVFCMFCMSVCVCVVLRCGALRARVLAFACPPSLTPGKILPKNPVVMWGLQTVKDRSLQSSPTLKIIRREGKALKYGTSPHKQKKDITKQGREDERGAPPLPGAFLPSSFVRLSRSPPHLPTLPSSTPSLRRR